MSKSDILAAMKEVEGQILAWNQNILESMRYVESRFADFHSKSISDNSSCWSVIPHFPHLKSQCSSQTAASTIPHPPRSPPLPLNLPQALPKNDPAPPKQTPSQWSFEELIMKIEAKIAANALTPPPQPESSNDTQVVTSATSVTDLQTISQEEQPATKIVVSVYPCETKKMVFAPEMRGLSNAYKVFDALTERNSSSPKEEAAAGTLREKSYIFVEEKRTEKLAGDSSTNKIGYVRKVLDELIHRAQVNMKEKRANLHIVPAATDYFEKKGAETLHVFDPGGSAFDAWVREAGNSLFDVFCFSCFKIKWVYKKVHDWMCDSFPSYCYIVLKYLVERLRMNRQVILSKVASKSIVLGLDGCNICWFNVICLVLFFKNVLSILSLARSLTDCNGTLVELSVWKWLKDGNGTCLQTDPLPLVRFCEVVSLFEVPSVCCYNLCDSVTPSIGWWYYWGRLMESRIASCFDHSDSAIIEPQGNSEAKSGKHDEYVESALSVQEVIVGDEIDDGLFLELRMIAEGLIEWGGQFSIIHLEDKVVLKVCRVIQLGIGDTSLRNCWGILLLLAQGPAPDGPNPLQLKPMVQISKAH